MLEGIAATLTHLGGKFSGKGRVEPYPLVLGEQGFLTIQQG